MSNRASRLYTGAAGIFLLLQGISTLTFRLIPALDRAFPPLLATTEMQPAHSMLHILSGVLAVFALMRGGERPLWFAGGFGLFYLALGAAGMAFGQPAFLMLQPFDHPIHFVLGIFGLLAAGIDLYRINQRKKAA